MAATAARIADGGPASAWIDAYLAALPDEQRATLQALRETIAAAAPAAVEAISYGMPAFRYRGRALVSYLAAKAHCSLFPMGSAAIEHLRDELVGYSTSKGTIRFTPEHPLPTDLVTRIVHARMTALDAALATKHR
jgi:uncharacterized protein YdhG (YjbR/CyaY superfamily)